MKFYTLLAAVAIYGLGAEDMKLVHAKTGFVVVEFNEGKALFFDRFLEEELKDRGIFIPQAERSQFDGKKVVFPSDPLFEKAFVEVYYPLSIAQSVYKWQKD